MRVGATPTMLGSELDRARGSLQMCRARRLQPQKSPDLTGTFHNPGLADKFSGGFRERLSLFDMPWCPERCVVRARAPGSLQMCRARRPQPPPGPIPQPWFAENSNPFMPTCLQAVVILTAITSAQDEAATSSKPIFSLERKGYHICARFLNLHLRHKRHRNDFDEPPRLET
jgi:hypothetical protein